jgi:hypothetical protein
VARTALTLALFTGLSLWASAQQRATEFHQQLKQLDANRLLPEQLIDCGLDLSSVEKGGNSLVRAEECRVAATKLAAALKTAPPNDAERVAELSDHIAAVVRDGLIPNLTDAHNGGGSLEQREKLANISRDARTDLSNLDKSLPSGETFDRSASLTGARQKLAEARQKLAEIDAQINAPRK